MFFEDKEEFTKYGYYLVHGIKTLSKFEAWKLSGGDMANVRFIFNDDVFEKEDWTAEPAEDIYELYAQRAIQLRKDYDYLVLMYSGGIDSHVMLKTFLENNIQIDEICTFSNTDVEEKTGKLNQEVFNKAIPFVQTLDLKKLGTKFRHIDIGKLVIDQWSDEFYFENFHHFTHGPQWHVIRSHKFKENIKPIENALEKVQGIGGKTYDWTDEYVKDHGGEDGYFVQKIGEVQQLRIHVIFSATLHGIYGKQI
jgi:hypothetical protein